MKPCPIFKSFWKNRSNQTWWSCHAQFRTGKLILQDYNSHEISRNESSYYSRGGGPEINYWLQKKQAKKTKFVHGLRVTDKHTIELVEMVLSGNINQKIVQQINNLGGRAIGISGKDAQLIQTKRELPLKQN